MVIDDVIVRLTTAADRLAGSRAVVEAGAPWPLSDNFGTDPEASWGPPETLAHVAEMLPFWIGEIERVLDGDEPAAFGRVATDELRLMVIERDRSLPPRELFERIAWSATRAATRLGELAPEQANRRGMHPRLGEMPVAAIADRFIVSHLEEHAEQLAAAAAER